MNVIQAIDALVGREGRYSNNANDAGGETMWGVTIAVARANGYAGRMIDMPRSTASAIYLRVYFQQPRFSDVATQSPRIAEELFDTGVNMGVGVAGTFLQRSLNVLNKTHTALPLYPDLVVDGGVGNNTLYALSLYLKARKAEGETVLMRMLNALQGEHYIGITEGRVKNEEFIYGWFLNRVVL